MSEYSLAWRPRKRAVQSKLTDRITRIKDFDHKKIITLCGPDLDGTVGTYEMYGMHKNGIILAEINKSQVCRAILHSSKKNIGNKEYLLKDNKKAHLINGDVFDIAHCYKNKISGFDFDFCTTLTNEKIHKIYATVKNSMVEDVWVRITTCHRTHSKQKLGEMLKYMKQKFLEEFDEIDTCIETYRDNISPAMNVWQMIMRRKEIKEQKMTRKMGELKEQEKDMLRILIDHKNLYRSITVYNEADIANLFGVSKDTISALKAVSTMRNKKSRG